MMINAANHTLTARTFIPSETVERMSLIEWVLKRIQRILCGLHGHDSVLQYERTRMFLRCTSCGHETPGWDVVPGRLEMTRAESRPARAPELTVVRKIA